MGKRDTQRVQHRDVNAGKRAALALHLRAQKLTYEEIAQQCGYADRGASYKAVQRELQRTVVENVDELRREDLTTLDVLQAECMAIFLDKENRGRLFAADRVLSIMERRAKLMGLDVAKDGNIVAAQVVVRELPAGYLGEVKS
jgi:hypothetical protein